MLTILLLISSNIFMSLAWYGHLRFKGVPLWTVILISWVIALPEYALQVPANRFGHGQFSAAQLKIIQEVISLTVFFVFAAVYLGEKPTFKTMVAFMLIIGAVVVAFWDEGKAN
ncbi:MAG: DMT family protein [Gemmataceae bacterium]|jgi:uncharacterized protein (DUF486 family)